MQTFQHRPDYLMISFVVTAFMTFVIGKFYGIHEESMEPIIMLKIHHLTEATLLTFCNLFLRSYGIEKVFLESGAKIYCIVTNFLNYYTTLCMLCSCTILHYEVYQYNLSRSNRLDLQAVKDRIFSSKGILFLVTVVGFSLDKPAQKCQNNENPEFNMIIKNYALWVAIPYFIALCSISIVLRYAFKKKKNHETKLSRKHLTVKTVDETVPRNGNCNQSDAADNNQNVPGLSRLMIATNKVHPSVNENNVEFSDEQQKMNQKENVMYPDESLDSDEEPVQASQENPITAFVDVETVPTKGNIIKSSAVSNEQNVFDRVTTIQSDSKYKTNKTPPSSKYIQVLEINQREEEHCIMHMKDSVDRDEDKIVVLETEFITIEEKSQSNSEKRETIDEENVSIKDEHFLNINILTTVIEEHHQAFCIFLTYFIHLNLIIYLFLTDSDSSQSNSTVHLIIFRLSGIFNLIMTLVYFILVFYE